MLSVHMYMHTCTCSTRPHLNTYIVVVALARCRPPSPVPRGERGVGGGRGGLTGLHVKGACVHVHSYVSELAKFQ